MLNRIQDNIQDIEGMLNWRGCSPTILQKIGAFIVMWGDFECALERVIWAIRDGIKAGIRPCTDRSTVSDWIQNLRELPPQFPDSVKIVISHGADAADDLKEYRHSIMHGWLIPGDEPWFCRNPTWHGEIRKRTQHSSLVNERLLDMAISSTWTLGCLAHLVKESMEPNSDAYNYISSMANEIKNARSMASELRHLSETGPL